jgi:hypothetical protein
MIRFSSAAYRNTMRTRNSALRIVLWLLPAFFMHPTQSDTCSRVIAFTR